MSSNDLFVFPKWMNQVRTVVAVGGAVAAVYVVLLVSYGAVPQAMDVGYQPDQPIPYDHSLHVGKLGMDCQYCHNTVEYSAHASIPPSATCLNCHSLAFENESPASNLDYLRATASQDAPEAGSSIPWVRVHDLPDYAYFNHAAHVNRGVGCVTCHGRVDLMPKVYQAKDLSMSWCLECHRNPLPNLRPLDKITDMQYDPSADPDFDPAQLKEELNINPPTDCSTCHR